jgi:Restriction endonuclease
MGRVGVTDADLYERFVQGLYYQYLLPGDGLGTKYTLHHRKSYIGLKTGNTHEVDLSFEAHIGSMRFLILIECKYYRRRVGKEIVEELHARIDDIGAHKGAIVTTVGFQKGALNAAKAYGIALIIATVSPDWFENPDPSCLLDPQWKFMNHGYIPVPFFGPWPMGCAHHGRFLISSLVSSLRDEIEGWAPPWSMHPHLPEEGRSIIAQDNVYDSLGKIRN